jgi:uncharacterized protein YjiS (DUF1127 family)
MTTVFPTHRVLAIFHSLRTRLRRAAEHRRAHEAFNRLDEATLRDLGLSRGEFTSYWLEGCGALPPTRRRVHEGVVRGCGA